VSSKYVSDNVRKALRGTQMFISPGPCINVKIAHCGMENDAVVENIMQVHRLHYIYFIVSFILTMTDITREQRKLFNLFQKSGKISNLSVLRY